jgi:hypothetical protein
MYPPANGLAVEISPRTVNTGLRSTSCANAALATNTLHTAITKLGFILFLHAAKAVRQLIVKMMRHRAGRSSWGDEKKDFVSRVSARFILISRCGAARIVRDCDGFSSPGGMAFDRSVWWTASDGDD